METVEPIGAGRERQRPPPTVRASWLAAIFLLVLGNTATGQDDREYAIKAAHLFHLTQFIQWPAEALPDAGEPFRIGVLRPSPFGSVLEEILEGQTVNDHPIEVGYFSEIERAEDWHMVFIPGRAGVVSSRKVLNELQGEPVLLVGERPDFTRAGGMISLVRERDKVEILINRRVLDAVQLSASSRLLRLARIVEDPPDS